MWHHEQHVASSNHSSVDDGWGSTLGVTQVLEFFVWSCCVRWVQAFKMLYSQSRPTQSVSPLVHYWGGGCSHCWTKLQRSCNRKLLEFWRIQGHAKITEPEKRNALCILVWNKLISQFCYLARAVACCLQHCWLQYCTSWRSNMHDSFHGQQMCFSHQDVIATGKSCLVAVKHHSTMWAKVYENRLQRSNIYI